jgi:polar amino acid transport system permease protein
MRVILPPMANETISMLKNTSILSVIAVVELYTVATFISSQNLRQVEMLIVVSIWYLALTTLLALPQFYLERRFARGSNQNSPRRPSTRPRQVSIRGRAS